MAIEQQNGSVLTLGFADAVEVVTPFGFAAAELEGESLADTEVPASNGLTSPFAGGITAEGEGEQQASETLAGELEDLAFQEAIQSLVDEVAARHLSSLAVSAEAEGTARADREVESWLESLAGEADLLLEHLEADLGNRELENLTEREVEASAASYFAAHGPADLTGEQFLGKLVHKIGKVAKGVVNVVKKGVAAVGTFLPFGKIVSILKRLVRPLLQRVLRTAINRLPAPLREPASRLAQKILGEVEGLTDAEIIGTELDARLAEAMVADNETETDHLLAEFEGESGTSLERHDEGGELDRARARLVDQVLKATPGHAPVAEVEQFIPAVMAAMPLLRVGIGIVGRDKIARLLGVLLANFIAGSVGRDMATQLGRPLADVGLRALGLEAETGGGSDRLGAEALVAAMEDTIREVGALSAEALAEPARLEAEVQLSFSEAAARYLPREALRPDLPTHEVGQEQESANWIYLPRRARPHYRYKKYTRIFRVPVSQPTARAIVLSDGDTLERRLLDSGVRLWPAEAEVHLYETVPGTQLGHLALELEGESGAASEGALEFEELTPTVAGVLLGQPGLGRLRPVMTAATVAAGGGLPVGVRFFRVRVRGHQLRRRRLLLTQLDRSGGATPTLRVALRLSEREARAVAAGFRTGAAQQAVAVIRALLHPGPRGVLTRQIARCVQKALQVSLSTARAATLGEAVAEAMITEVARSAQTLGPQVARAAEDAAVGVTLAFAFPFASVAALERGAVPAPTLDVRPGGRDG